MWCVCVWGSVSDMLVDCQIAGNGSLSSCKWNGSASGYHRMRARSEDNIHEILSIVPGA